MTASLLATKGIGFREPWRFFMNGRSTQLLNAQPPRMMNAPEFSNELAANFATANTRIFLPCISRSRSEHGPNATSISTRQA